MTTFEEAMYWLEHLPREYRITIRRHEPSFSQSQWTVSVIDPFPDMDAGITITHGDEDSLLDAIRMAYDNYDNYESNYYHHREYTQRGHHEV